MTVLVKYSRCPTFPNIVFNTITIAELTGQESTAVKANSSLTPKRFQKKYSNTIFQQISRAHEFWILVKDCESIYKLSATRAPVKHVHKQSGNKNMVPLDLC